MSQCLKVSLFAYLGRQLSTNTTESWASAIVHRIQCAHFHRVYTIAIEDAGKGEQSSFFRLSDELLRGSSPANTTELNETVAALRASLAHELHHTLCEATMSKRNRIVCVGLFALTISPHPTYMYDRYSSVFSGLMIEFDYVNEDMLSESLVLWVGLMMATMHVSFMLSLKDRWNLLHRTVAHQGASSKWSDIRCSMEQVCAPKGLHAQWERCWGMATKMRQAKRWALRTS